MSDARGLAERGARARALAGIHASCADVLAFYAALVDEQARWLAAAGARPVPRAAGLYWPVDAARRAAESAPRVIAWLAGTGRHAPGNPAAWRAWTAREWRRPIVERLSEAEGEAAPDARAEDDVRAFVVEASIQPFAAAPARAAEERPDGEAFPWIDRRDPGRCPRCASRPVVAVLDERGHGSALSLVCGLCLLEWPAGRGSCVACGEAHADRLPHFRSDGLPAARVDACDTCRRYIKTIDRTRDGAAIPAVDDLASLALDLWAAERGYRKIRPNLLRL
jgi:hypothetical protein